MRKLIFMGLILLLMVMPSLGCGKIEPEIRTAYLLDTNDTQGPYRIMAVVTGDLQLSKVLLVYTTDQWKDPNKIKTITMEQVDPSMQDVFQGKIEGQKSGTVISYYILVVDNEKKTTTDPEKMTDNPSKLLPANPKLTYRFRILK